MNLVQAIQPTLPARIAIVGGGGKTTTLFQLARQLPGLVWATTTTHLGTDQLDNTDQHFIISEPAEIDLPRLKAKRSTLITGLFTLDDRVRGPEADVMAELVTLADREGISLVVEADGARSHPVKAPADHEPAIPAWANTVIVVVGLSALGKPATSDWIHRLERFEALTGLQEGAIITMKSITDLLVNPLGGLKGIPSGVRKVALLNQADTDLVTRQSVSSTKELLAGGFDSVVVGSLKFAPDDLQKFS
jgi:probable selenium-dependent hydroxylase accessory protein YqeC